MKYVLALVVCFAFAETAIAQKKITGNVITEYGSTFTVPNPDITTEKNQEFKVVFDIADSPEDPSQLNRYFETVARFLNMHENAGVPLNKLKPVMVVHGSAAYGLLKNDFYAKEFGTDNPNLELLDALHNAGVKIILCGQTAGSRNITKEKRWEHTQLALSAMTALIQFQNKGYQLISF